MRTIKFRGKTAYGNWVVGSLSTNDVGDYFIESYNKIGIRSTVLVTPATVGQFTGLLDRNGTEIYEGDVVRYIGNDCGHYFNSEVSYKGAGFDPIAFMYESGAISDMEENDQDLHIIGNIHDNPELLKTK